eukprot:maker-scaffold374_size191929-snap-gene-0.37 protein:Tk01261 transcript:maker-scaffold374_size191929-snap-gene-0.37-mRNA-1 annotation:"1-like protein"
MGDDKRLPKFWPHSADAWFTRTEGFFRINEIADDNDRFDRVVNSFPDAVSETMALATRTVPANGQYDYIKQKLQEVYVDTLESRVSSLLAFPTMPDENPKVIARKLLTLTVGEEPKTVLNAILKATYLRALGPKYTSILAAGDNDLKVMEKEAFNIYNHASKADETTSSIDEAELASLELEIDLVEAQLASLKDHRDGLCLKRKQLKAARQKARNDALQSRDWAASDFPWSQAMDGHLREAFGLDRYRPHQLECMNALLSGHDVMLIMPTGGGKSLAYQLPALVAPGLTLVVSPLLALMEDQVMSLQRRGIPAEMLCGDTPRAEVTRIMNAMTDPKSTMKLLYVTPEKLAKSKRFMTKLQTAYKKGLFSHLAIDEVHCCSQWGHDFRTDYKFLGVMKSLFPKVPLVGLTATSTASVTLDTQKILNLKDCLVFKAAFNRPNLFYEVRPKASSHDESIQQLTRMLGEEFKGQSGIIYALTIKDVEALAKDLRDNGIKAAPYHAHLEGQHRSKTHKKWLTGQIQVVVATIAFGMGIDKPNVRFVIHHSISKSMENFYQESGRAGRDDAKAKCIAFYKFGDIFKISTMVFTERTGLEKLYGMVVYCTSFNRCRRSIIADHFDEVWESRDCNEMCDSCQGSGKESAGPLDVTQYAQAVLKIMAQAALLDVKMTALKMVNALLNKGESKYRLPGWDFHALDQQLAELILANMLLREFIKEDFAFTPYSTLSYLVQGPRTLNAGHGMEILAPTKVPTTTATKRKLPGTTAKAKKAKGSPSTPSVVVISDEDA